MRRLVLIGGAVVIAVLLAATTVVVVTRRGHDLPPEEGRAFLAAWGRGDGAAVDRMAVPGIGARPTRPASGTSWA